MTNKKPQSPNTKDLSNQLIQGFCFLPTSKSSRLRVSFCNLCPKKSTKMAVWNTIKKHPNLLPFQQRPTFLHGNLLEDTHNAYHHTLRHLRFLTQMLIHSPGKKTSHFTILQKVDTWSLGHHGLIYLNLFDCFTFIGSKAIDCCGFPVAGRSFWILSTFLQDAS